MAGRNKKCDKSHDEHTSVDSLKRILRIKKRIRKLLKNTFWQVKRRIIPITKYIKKKIVRVIQITNNSVEHHK